MKMENGFSWLSQFLKSGLVAFSPCDVYGFYEINASCISAVKLPPSFSKQ
jgi:hypothetical protein